MNKEQQKYWKKAQAQMRKASDACGQLGLDIVMAGQQPRLGFLAQQLIRAQGILYRAMAAVDRGDDRADALGFARQSSQDQI
jgi:hypothetical protein